MADGSTIAEQLQSIVTAKANIITALTNKGCDIPDGTKLGELADIINDWTISSGGSSSSTGVYSYTTQNENTVYYKPMCGSTSYTYEVDMTTKISWAPSTRGILSAQTVRTTSTTPTYDVTLLVICEAANPSANAHVPGYIAVMINTTTGAADCSSPIYGVYGSASSIYWYDSIEAYQSAAGVTSLSTQTLTDQGTSYATKSTRYIMSVISKASNFAYANVSYNVMIATLA